MAWRTESAKEEARLWRAVRSVAMMGNQSVASGERSSSWGDVLSEQHFRARRGRPVVRRGQSATAHSATGHSSGLPGLRTIDPYHVKLRQGRFRVFRLVTE